MLPAPNLSQYSYEDGEELLLAYLFNNHQVDDILVQCNPDTMHNPMIKGVFTICSEYAFNIGNGVIDFNSIIAALSDMGKGTPENIQYLTHVRYMDLTSAPTPEYIIQKIKDLHVRRSLLLTSYTTYMQALQPTVNVKDLVLEAEERLVNINTTERQKVEVIFARDIPQRRKELFEDRYNARPVMTGWTGFDNMLSVGFLPGKMPVIAGRTSMGKSLFKTNLIINMCKSKVGIINVCPEQGFGSEHDRIDSVLSGVSLKQIIKINKLDRIDPKHQLLHAASEKTVS